MDIPHQKSSENVLSIICRNQHIFYYTQNWLNAKQDVVYYLETKTIELWSDFISPWEILKISESCEVHQKFKENIRKIKEFLELEKQIKKIKKNFWRNLWLICSLYFNTLGRITEKLLEIQQTLVIYDFIFFGTSSEDNAGLPYYPADMIFCDLQRWSFIDSKINSQFKSKRKICQDPKPNVRKRGLSQDALGKKKKSSLKEDS